MKHTDKPTTTASAPETRTKHSICRFQEASDYNERTIPAEKPTGIYIDDIAVANYCDKLQAQSAQLAEALEALDMAHNHKTLVAAKQNARKALAAYEESR